MPIEIKELVIRAIVDDSRAKTQPAQGSLPTDDKQDCRAEKIDLLIQLIKDKNER
ncbi:DUF5908 family protein [Mangrovibacterium sp.]|uniref:DUF5908 family protein n=1 Tax=Mangrovibacterium sp. TaxID=1961364 RepID=UPI0035633164